MKSRRDEAARGGARQRVGGRRSPAAKRHDTWGATRVCSGERGANEGEARGCGGVPARRLQPPSGREGTGAGVCHGSWRGERANSGLLSIWKREGQ